MHQRGSIGILAVLHSDTARKPLLYLTPSPHPFDVHRQPLPTFLFLCFVIGVFVDVERIGKPVSNDVYRKYEEVFVDKKRIGKPVDILFKEIILRVSSGSPILDMGLYFLLATFFATGFFAAGFCTGLTSALASGFSMSTSSTVKISVSYGLMSRPAPLSP